jgi:hypothetical protein
MRHTSDGASASLKWPRPITCALTHVAVTGIQTVSTMLAAITVLAVMHADAVSAFLSITHFHSSDLQWGAHTRSGISARREGDVGACTNRAAAHHTKVCLQGVRRSFRGHWLLPRPSASASGDARAAAAALWLECQTGGWSDAPARLSEWPCVQVRLQTLPIDLWMHLISQTEDVVGLSALSRVQCMTLCNARSNRLAFCVKQALQA